MLVGAALNPADPGEPAFVPNSGPRIQQDGQDWVEAEGATGSTCLERSKPTPKLCGSTCDRSASKYSETRRQAGRTPGEEPSRAADTAPNPPSKPCLRPSPNREPAKQKEITNSLLPRADVCTRAL
jgi:hypothetical protein